MSTTVNLLVEASDPKSKQEFDEEEYNAARGYKNGRMYGGDHYRALGRRLVKFFPATAYSDCLLKTESTSLRVHKLIMAAQSSFFHDIFMASKTATEDTTDYNMKDLTDYGLKALVDYAYNGGFLVSERMVHEVLHAAEYCSMLEVKALCELFLVDEVNVTGSNYADMYELTKVYNLQKFAHKCDHYQNGCKVYMDNYLNFTDYAKFRKSGKMMKKLYHFYIQNIPKLLKADDLMRLLEPRDIKEIIAIDRHALYTDMNLVEFLINWIQTDEVKRLPWLVDLFRRINLTAFDLEQLDEIAYLPLIKKDPDCQGYIEDAKNFIRNIQTKEKEGGPYVLTFSGLNIELRSLGEHDSATRPDILVLPRIPEELAQCKGNETLQNTPFVTTLDNILYIFGLYWRGKRGDIWTEDSSFSCHSYDPSRNKWRELACLHGARSGNKLVALNGLIYSIAVMSSVQKDGLNKVNVYDPVTNTWQTSPPLPHSVATPLVASAGGQLYVSFTEAWDKAFTDEFYSFDPRDKTWAKQTRVPKLRRCYDLGSCRDQVYQFGIDVTGLHGEKLRTDCYDAKTDQWTILRKKHEFGSLLEFQVLNLNEITYIMADYRTEDEAGTRSRETGFFIFDHQKETLQFERAFERIDRAKTSTALLFVPQRTLRAVQKEMQRRGQVVKF